MTDISLSGVKGHLPKFYGYFNTLLHPAETARKLLEYKSHHEHQKGQWNMVKESMLVMEEAKRDKEIKALKKQLLPAALGA